MLPILGPSNLFLIVLVILPCVAYAQNLPNNDTEKMNVQPKGWEDREDPERKLPLWIQGLVCMDGSWPDGPTVIKATEMAMDHIHAQKSMLPGHRLRFQWVNTKCDPGTGAFRMIQNLQEGPPKVMIMGAALSPVSESTALLSHSYNLTQISYDSGSPSLSNKKLYPNFFRVYITATARVPPAVAMCKYFGWNKVATIHQALDVFASYIEFALSMFKENNMTIMTSEIFNEDPVLQVANLNDKLVSLLGKGGYVKAHDARIIVVGSYVDVGIKLFCEAYHLGMYGPRMVWFIGNWWTLNWWNLVDESTPCTKEQLFEVSASVIRIGQFQINPNQEVDTVSGYTPRQLEDLWKQKTGGVPQFFEQARFIMYDTVWAVALALNGTLTDTMQEDGTSPLSTFTYSNGELGRIIKANMAKVRFSGARGYTEFDEFGDCKTAVKIVHNRGKKTVGMYGRDSTGVDTLTWFGDGIQWPENRIPRDSTLRIQKLDFISWNIYISLISVATLGLVLSSGFFTFNVVFRKKRLIKMSSPNMNNILLLGCILIYITIFLHEQNKDYTVIFCTARNFTMTMGFSLVFGSLFSKTWRVHVIFTTKNVKGVGIRDSQLVGLVVGLVTLNGIVLVLWTILDLYTVTFLNTSVEIILEEGQDIMIQHQVPLCTSFNGVYFRWTLYIVQAALLAFGAFLAWETRQVKLEALNDSQLIGNCIYNVVILSMLGVGLGVVLEDEPHLVATLVDIFLLLGTTITQCIIFMPKVLGVLKGQGDVAPSTMKTDTTTATEA